MGDKSSSDARQRRESAILVAQPVVLDVDESPSCDFNPGMYFPDAVLELIAHYNSQATGLPLVHAGDVLRVRVVRDDKKVKYSELDRLIFEGQQARSLYEGAPEVHTVGAFAKLPADATDPVTLQIASYGRPTMQKSTSNGKGEDPAAFNDLLEALGSEKAPKE